MDSSSSSVIAQDTAPSSASSTKTANDNLHGYSSSTGHFAGLMHGDSATMLKSLPSDVFNVAVTSPPYFWVRDYGYDGQLGHEESVQTYIEALMGVFDEVKRTLHPEGVFFLNIGDTYYSGNGQPHGSDPKCSSRNFLRKKVRPVDVSGWDIPKKSMIGIPWKVAFEMQQRGWTLRSSIIWNRCNAFVEPTARDRPTGSTNSFSCSRRADSTVLIAPSSWKRMSGTSRLNAIAARTTTLRSHPSLSGAASKWPALRMAMSSTRSSAAAPLS